MKKTIICNIPMKKNIDPCIYKSFDRSLPASERAVVYPINAFLEKTLAPEDELKIVLLVKKDDTLNYEKNVKWFEDEFLAVNEAIGAKYEIKTIDTDFSEDIVIHERLMKSIVDEIQENVEILTDITYGPKDLAIIVFAALTFAHKHLGCDIEHVIYGQSYFDGNGKPHNTNMCDMAPLLYMVMLSASICSNDPDRARQMLNEMLSY